MKIEEILVQNEQGPKLKNDGVVHITGTSPDVTEWELQTFVCKGEYQKGLERILNTYLANFDGGRQPAAWVSGFFGSGKSHLVKMLAYLWEDTKLPTGRSARSIVNLSEDVKAHLVELQQKQVGYGSLVISGSISDSSNVYRSVIRLILQKLDLPQELDQFRFLYWLKQEGKLDDVKSYLTNQGKDLFFELDHLYVSPSIAEALLALMPNFAPTVDGVRTLLKAQFKTDDKPFGKEEFVREIKDRIFPFAGYHKTPAMLIALDEVQQNIIAHNIPTITIQDLTETLSSSFDGRLLFVCTGQNSLIEVESLSKLQDRFSIRVQLGDQDVNAVIRDTVLRKQPTGLAHTKELLDKNSAEADKQFQGTALATDAKDREFRVADYPILPTTRKLWHRILIATNTDGNSGQLRGQLRLVFKATQSILSASTGTVIPADFIYSDIVGNLSSSAQLTPELAAAIATYNASKDNIEVLKGRIVTAVYLLRKAARTDTPNAIKVTRDRVADCLVGRIDQPSQEFRAEVNRLVKVLVDAGELAELGDELAIQSTQGREWKQDFDQRIKALVSQADKTSPERQARFEEAINKVFKKQLVNATQGNSKILRIPELYLGTVAPPENADKLYVWLKDGWSFNFQDLQNEIRAQDQKVALGYIYLPRDQSNMLSSPIVKYIAAQDVLSQRAITDSPEAKEARKSMETIRDQAHKEIADAIQTVLGNAQVFLAGGSEMQGINLDEKLKTTFQHLAARKYTDFGPKADYVGWDKALAAAQKEQPDALSKINFNGDVEAHPLAKTLLGLLDAGRLKGSEIRKRLMGPPIGAAQDAVDTLLLLLDQKQYFLKVPNEKLTSQSLGKIEFAKQKTEPPTSIQVMQARSLLNQMQVTCNPNDNFDPKFREFVQAIKFKVQVAYGEAPKHPVPDLDWLWQLEYRAGHELIRAFVQYKPQVEALIIEILKDAQIVAERWSQWETLSAIMDLAKDYCQPDQRKNYEAILAGRLLPMHPDPVAPLLKEVVSTVQTTYGNAKAAFTKSYYEGEASLQAHEAMKKLGPDQKLTVHHQANLLPAPDRTAQLLDANGLLQALRGRGIKQWETEKEALTHRFEQATQHAIRLAEPKAVFHTLRRATISTEIQLEDYLAELRTDILAKLQNAPSVNLN